MKNKTVKDKSAMAGQDAAKAAAQFPVRQMAAVGIGGTWLAVAAAETLMSNGQDVLDDVGMIAENYPLIAVAGLLHWAGGILLVLGLAGLAPLLWASMLGRVAWLLMLPLAVGFGAFSMVHLLALETAAPGLDGAAMNEYLTQRLGDGTGPWIIPITFVALLGPWSFLLMLISLVRLRLAVWAAPAVFVAGAVVHMLIADELAETLSLWAMAAGGVLAAVGIWRTSSVDAASLDSGSPAATRSETAAQP